MRIKFQELKLFCQIYLIKNIVPLQNGEGGEGEERAPARGGRGRRDVRRDEFPRQPNFSIFLVNVPSNSRWEFTFYIERWSLFLELIEACLKCGIILVKSRNNWNLFLKLIEASNVIKNLWKRYFIVNTHACSNCKYLVFKLNFQTCCGCADIECFSFIHCSNREIKEAVREVITDKARGVEIQRRATNGYAFLRSKKMTLWFNVWNILILVT